MGRAIATEATERGAMVSGGVDRDGAIHGPYADASALAPASDVLIDFSIPAALAGHLAAARAAGTPIVIGTTGLQPEHHAMIDEAAREIPVIQAANTSLGVNLLGHLVREAAARLGTDWDIEIVEMHHRHKADAPSGTALMLGNAAAAGMGTTLAEAEVTDRAGTVGPRSAGTIGLASLRGGSVVGDHSVVFATQGERIELIHRADDRAIFARGAVRAALWLAGRPAGRYTMDQVLGG